MVLFGRGFLESELIQEPDREIFKNPFRILYIK
jgi:hypothetical protein